MKPQLSLIISSNLGVKVDMVHFLSVLMRFEELNDFPNKLFE